MGTYFSQQGNCTRIDYCAIPASALHRVQKCECWQYSGCRLQLAQGVTRNIDHIPLVVDVVLNNPAESET
eukprot:3518850-Pyramimonas_sp.AAC.1